MVLNSLFGGLIGLYRHQRISKVTSEQAHRKYCTIYFTQLISRLIQ